MNSSSNNDTANDRHTQSLSVLQHNLFRVREWKASKRVSMNRKQVRRCAKDLGMSSAEVRDAMNAAGIEYKF